MNAIALQEEKKKILLMGNEAIARGAIEANVDLISAYPGTPSSEVVESLAEVADNFNYYVEWSMNEKVAFDIAAGAALTGKRSLVVMKNAGLNVAMDTFMTLPYTGVKGGMVIVVADDPGAHYSSNEQDTRLAAEYAEIPCFEPADQQEAKDMTVAAFELSERLELPVFLRSVTRLSHASGDVVLGEIKDEKRIAPGFNKHWEKQYRWNVYGPPGAVSKHAWLHGQLEKAPGVIEEFGFDSFVLPEESDIGIIAAGLGAAYAMEAVEELDLAQEIGFLKLGSVYPVSDKRISEFISSLKKVIVVEEGDPLVERKVWILSKEVSPHLEIFGKGQRKVLDPYGELNVDRVRGGIIKALNREETTDPERTALKKEIYPKIAPRSSTLCAGCPHLGTYWSLKEVLRKIKGVHIVNGDIGCYEQGGYGVFSDNIQPDSADSRAYQIKSPYEILDTIYVMGSGIGMAIGQAHSGYRDGKVLAVAGDSTFYHAILPAVADAVYSDADITFLVMDNSWTCMTGHQPNPTTGKSTTGGPAPIIKIEEAARSLGIKNIQAVDAYNLEQSSRALKKALEFTGPSIVVLRRECALQVQRRERIKNPSTYVDRSKCTGCRKCLELGCPAVTYDAENKKAGIDTLLCMDCGLCNQVCPFEAIRLGGE